MRASCTSSARNTSAYAEKTLGKSDKGSFPEKHLRLRGENASSICSKSDAGETPPLTRRKQSKKMDEIIRTRNTSAYAEKTFGIRTAWPSLGKHLRLRGENPMQLRDNTLSRETPPLTRRKRLTLGKWIIKKRNTSAYAEKTKKSEIFLRT